MFEHARFAEPRARARLLHRRHGPRAGRRLAGEPAAGPRGHDAGRRLPAVPDRRPGRRRPGPQPARRRPALERRRRRRGLLGPGALGARARRPPGARRGRSRRRLVARSSRRAAAGRRMAARDGLRRARRGRGARPASPDHAGARRLLADAVDADRSRPEPTRWPWPEPRLALRQRGARRGPDRRRAAAAATTASRPTGCACCDWLLDARDRATVTCRSPRSAAGRAGDPRPGSTSSRSRSPRWPTPAPGRSSVTGDRGWLTGVDRCVGLVPRRQRRRRPPGRPRHRRRLRRPAPRRPQREPGSRVDAGPDLDAAARSTASVRP